MILESGTTDGRSSLASRYVIRTATAEDCEYLVPRVRRMDLREVEGAWGLPMHTTLHRAVDQATRCWTGLVDGEPAVIFGVTRLPDMAEGHAHPWLMATPLLETQPPGNVAYLSREFLPKLTEGFELLDNWVDVRNVRAIRWLQWLGFELVHMVRAYGVYRMPSWYFRMVVPENAKRQTDAASR